MQNNFLKLTDHKCPRVFQDALMMHQTPLTKDRLIDAGPKASETRVTAHILGSTKQNSMLEFPRLGPWHPEPTMVFDNLHLSKLCSSSRHQPQMVINRRRCTAHRLHHLLLGDGLHAAGGALRAAGG